MSKYDNYQSLELTIRDLMELRLMEMSMTDAQLKKREELVKGMKKDKKDFVDKYGYAGWKNVMHATATKMAMKSEEIKDEEQ